MSYVSLIYDFRVVQLWQMSFKSV